jgi:hypothetical protein
MFVAALVLVVAILAVTSVGTHARRDIMTDDFSGEDWSAPDTSKWEVDALRGSQEVFVRDGTLYTDMEGWDKARAVMLNDFTNNNYTMTVEFWIERDEWRPIEIGLFPDAGSLDYIIFIYYDQSGWAYLSDTGSHYSDLRNLQVGQWYRAEFNVTNNYLDFTVTSLSSGQSIWSFTDHGLAWGYDRHHFTIGVRSLDKDHLPFTIWDNFALYDHSMDPNVAPEWYTLPILQATEDVVLSVDFSPYVIDDQPLDQLTVTSTSPYVVQSDGLQVDFLFPNGVTTANVPLILYDGYDSAITTVTVHIASVNDPPEEFVPSTLTVVEGITTTIDLQPYIADVDNPPEELTLLLTSEHIIVDGFLLEVHFPEGTADQTVELGITDGNATVWVSITFIITQVNNPPTLLPIDDMTMEEGVPFKVDISSLVSDPDDPVDDLIVTVSAHECTVDGLQLTFLYPDGDMTDLVLVRVSDGVGFSTQTFTVRILARNDPPIVWDIPMTFVNEDEVTFISLSNWITDEDHPAVMLSLSSDNPNVVSVTGLGLSVLYTDGGFQNTVRFNVTDGVDVVGGKFVVEVVEVNDLPRITGIGDQEAPYYFRLPTASQRTYPIMAADADDVQLRFGIESIYDGFSVQGPYLTIITDSFDTGVHTCYLNVYDNRGGKHRVKVVAQVVSRSHLPVDVTIISPVNDTAFNVGANITFRVRVSDPDGYLRDSTTVTWTSDEVGHLGTVLLTSGGNISLSSLPEGTHTIYVVIEDEDLSFTRWVVVDVGSASDDTQPVSVPAIYTFLLVVIIIVIIGTLVGVAMKRGAGDAGRRPTTGTRVPSPEEVHVPVSTSAKDSRVEADRKARSERVERVRETERAEASRARREEEAREARIRAEIEREEARKAEQERRYMAEREPPKAPSPVTEVHTVRAPVVPTPRAALRELPTEEEMDARRQDLIDALGRVPGGLPSALSLYDHPTIARRIVRGRKKWAQGGRLLAFVQGEWYYADPRDAEFMNIYRGD